MFRKGSLIAAVVALLFVFAIPAFAQGPGFGPAIYADGEVFATQGVAGLPAPNGNNVQSFDKLFVITNSNNPEGQLPVSEAGPGNRDYNGGRWFTHTVEWTQDGFDDHGTVPVLKSYDDIMTHYSLGHLTITEGPPDGPGEPPAYFECPLLPVK